MKDTRHKSVDNVYDIDNKKDSNRSLLSRLLLLSFCVQKDNSRNKGITLISLAITIIVLLILASVATYSGVEILRQSKFNSFTTELKVMQTEVDALYDRFSNGETEVLDIGKTIDLQDEQTKKVFTSEESGITQTEGYKYYDKETLETLGIENLDNEFFVNIEERSVISYEGLEYEGKMYYTLEQIPNGLYNVEYENRNTDEPEFKVSMKKIGDSKYRITISDIKYDGYISKWQVKYQKQGQDYWSTSEDLSFVVTDVGPYKIMIENNGVKSAQKDLEYTKPTLVKKWVAKIDGNGQEEFLDVEKTSDGGFIAVGYTTSTDISGLTNKGSADCLIAKYDAEGKEQWKKSVGGSKYDWYSGVIEITNGTYIAVGTILSTDVMDKDGINIGHGYDWSYLSNTMNASEGIIGTYDSNGNEVSLRTTGKSTDTFTGEGLSSNLTIDWTGLSSINVVLSGIDKLSNGDYIVTGKRLIGIPSSKASEYIVTGHLAIKYDKDENEISTTDIITGSMGQDDFIIDNYKDYTATYQIWNGVIEKTSENYILFGTNISSVGGTGLWKSDSNLKNVQEFGNARSIVKNCFLDKNKNYITLNYSQENKFIRIEKQDDNGNILWEKSDSIIKSISKSDEENFVGITEDDKFIKYSMEDGNVIESYEIPTYDKIYAAEGQEEFILLGTPTNEEGISITGTSGAVIAKYVIE